MKIYLKYFDDTKIQNISNPQNTFLKQQRETGIKKLFEKKIFLKNLFGI